MYFIIVKMIAASEDSKCMYNLDSATTIK